MNKPTKPHPHPAQPKIVFRLYVTGEAASSVRAIANMQKICRQYLSSRYELEIIDTLQNPIRAMQDGIIVTPTLVKLAPEPHWTVIGDLSEDARVLASMSQVAPNSERPPSRRRPVRQFSRMKSRRKATTPMEGK